MFFRLFALFVFFWCADAFARIPFEYSLYGSFAQAITTYRPFFGGYAYDHCGNSYGILGTYRTLTLKSGWGAGFVIAHPLNTFAAIGAELKYWDTFEVPDTAWPARSDAHAEKMRFNHTVLYIGPNFIFRYPVAKIVDIGTAIGLGIGRQQTYARGVSLAAFDWDGYYGNAAYAYYRTSELVPIFSVRPFVSLRLSPAYPVRLFAAYELLHAGTRNMLNATEVLLTSSEIMRPSIYSRKTTGYGNHSIKTGQYRSLVHPAYVTHIAHMFVIGMSIAN